MIKNIVFDLGRVLVNFDTISYLSKFNLEKDEIIDLNKIIFEGLEWRDCDMGKYSENTDIVNILCKKYPEYSEKIKLVLNKNWTEMLTTKDDTIEFLKELNEKNYRIFILSNLSEEAYYFISKYEFFKWIDGGVYSYQVKTCKPDFKIYNELLNKYKLIPEETIFIDDLQANVDASKKLNIHGIKFDTLEQVKKEVKQLIDL